MRVSMLGLLTVALSGWASGVAADESVWEKDYEQAKKIARASGKPIFLTFR
jgi:hypothetical protein